MGGMPLQYQVSGEPIFRLRIKPSRNRGRFSKSQPPKRFRLALDPRSKPSRNRGRFSKFQPLGQFLDLSSFCFSSTYEPHRIPLCRSSNGAETEAD